MSESKMNSKYSAQIRYLTSYVELEAFRAYIDQHIPKQNNNVLETLISLMGIIALGKTSLQDLDDFYANDYFKLALNLNFYERFDLSELLMNTEFLALLSALNPQSVHKQTPASAAAALTMFGAFEDGRFNQALAPVYQFIYAYLQHKENVQNAKNDGFKRVEFTPALHQQFLEQGYLIIEDFLTPAQVAELKDITHGLAKDELQNKSAYLYGHGNKLQRVYNLLNKHQRFRELIVTPTVLGILERVFSRDTLHQKYYLSSFQSNILNPGAEAQKLHVDSSVPDPLPPWLIRININFLLDDFTPTNGSTLVAPGSHHRLRKPQKNEEIDLINVLAPAGSIVMWTGHLWHKTSANTSAHSRTALLACFAASYLREVAVEENYLEVMSKETLNACSKELQNLLGVGHGIKQGAY